MSTTVIRDAVIRLRIEQEKSKLQAPEMQRMGRALAEQKKAAQEYGKAMQDYVGGSSIHWSNLSATTQKSSAQIVSHMTEGMEGVGRFTRGMVLLGATSEKEMQRVMVSIMRAQAGFDVIAGGAKFVKGLGLAFGTTGMAAGGLTLALGAGAIAWETWKAKAEAAKKAAEDARLEMEKLSAGVREVGFNAASRERDRASLRGATAITPEQQEAARRRQREDLAIQIKANDKYYANDSPDFFYNYRGGKQRLSDMPTVMRDRATKARDYEGERAKLLDLQIKQDKDLYQAQREKLALTTESNRLTFATASVMAPGVGSLPLSALGQQDLSQNQAAMQKMIQDQTQGLEKMVGAYNLAVERFTELKQILEISAPK